MVFLIRRLYSAVSLTLVREQRFTRIIIILLALNVVSSPSDATLTTNKTTVNCAAGMIMDVKKSKKVD